jgi:hypothetical protein
MNVGDETDWAYGVNIGMPWPACDVCGAEFMCGFSRYRCAGVGELDVIGQRCCDCHLPVSQPEKVNGQL